MSFLYDGIDAGHYTGKQVARNRAAGWVSCVQKWKTGTGKQYFADIIFNHCDVIGQQSYQIRWKKRKMRAITPLKVIQGHRGRYQSKARVRLPISV